jgi:hypothetical protein
MKPKIAQEEKLDEQEGHMTTMRKVDDKERGVG